MEFLEKALIIYSLYCAKELDRLAKLTIITAWLLTCLGLIGTQVTGISTGSFLFRTNDKNRPEQLPLTSFRRAALPVHVVHPICCKVETLDLGVTRFKGTRQKQSELF